MQLGHGPQRLGPGAAAATALARSRADAARPKPAGYGPDPACQPCPACGGLECLCRPRFFAGQLLTEQDLNRLDHYITGKHKLHNRHLFGWGVVCGLEVLCAPCDEGVVTVTTGYALSPCGEDIVVCKADTVDVCDLIARCRDDADPDCRPYQGRDPCDAVEERWVLAIRYEERPSRPVTPLLGAPACGCGAGGCKGRACACGGGCGCVGKAPPGFAAAAVAAPPAAPAALPRLRRGAPPTCEPTVTCEGYRYDVFRLPEEPPKPDPGQGGAAGGQTITGSLAGVFERLDGEMAARIACCLRELEAALPRPPAGFSFATDAERQAWFRWCCALRQGLATWYARAGGTDCEAMEKLGAIPCPDPALSPAAFQAALVQAVQALLVLTLQAALHCLCSNALPPCPGPEDPRVPLAVVTVRRRDCHVVSVCNWTPLRRHVVTMRTLGYWLGWTPLRRILRELMEQLCCRTLGLRFPRPDDRRPDLATGAGEAVAPDAPAAVGDRGLDTPAGIGLRLDPAFDARLGAAVLRRAAAPAEGGGPRTGDLFDLLLRRPAYAAPDGLDPEDEAKLVDRLADSGLARTLGALLHDVGEALPLGAAAAGVAPAPPAADRAGLAEMRTAVARQAEEIAALKADLAALRDAARRPG